MMGLNNPVRKHLDYEEPSEDLTVEDLAKIEVQKFFEHMGFHYEDFVNRYVIDEENNVIKVYVNIEHLENIPLLRGGKFLTVLQQISVKFIPTLKGKNYSWLFIREKLKIGSAEMGIFNEALARLGDEVVQKGGVEVLLTYDIVRQLANVMNTNTEAIKKQLEKELAQKGNILAI